MAKRRHKPKSDKPASPIEPARRETPEAKQTRLHLARRAKDKKD